MQNHHLEGYARARTADVARATAAFRPHDEWMSSNRRSLGDRVGRTLVAVGARLLDEPAFVETMAGSDRPRAA